LKGLGEGAEEAVMGEGIMAGEGEGREMADGRGEGAGTGRTGPTWRRGKMRTKYTPPLTYLSLSTPLLTLNLSIMSATSFLPNDLARSAGVCKGYQNE
jgi:hypothetical protein